MQDREVSFHIYEGTESVIPFHIHLQTETDYTVLRYRIPASYGNEILDAIEQVQNGKYASRRVLIPVECEEIRELVLLISRDSGEQNIDIFAYHPHAMRFNFRETLNEIIRIQGLPKMNNELVFI